MSNDVIGNKTIIILGPPDSKLGTLVCLLVHDLYPDQIVI